MVSIVDNSTTALLSLALDAAAMRQQAIAQNIANASTPGYQRVSVNFETRMTELVNDTAQGAAPSLAELANYRPTLEVGSGPGSTVALDQEMVQLSDTVLHHQALLKALGKHLELIGVAINEGKR